MKSGIDRIAVELPIELMAEAHTFVDEGWLSDLNGLFAGALRRYLDSHSPKINEAFIRADVEWGLHGHEESPSLE